MTDEISFFGGQVEDKGHDDMKLDDVGDTDSEVEDTVSNLP